ncbi:Pantoate-beta-alanine ligase [Acididesulfobacillus acetoxydans]|uniref:Pantothenate synthetase n=1 Tax=Acididesulfobacillus acetoxydans TaxID=1561005 RepID=A0A8S0W6K1_9FIRM|nr:pantoate--beta-alanine ligase [Acididesulfobacillus acetoxydans]CAA7599919.1 Pantoate-beta-alanine ligase [Acididesulfobacillus acetoxydans]CEJ06867.1 Pantothenate synthetase [Acididesulfobacillus acetoxydans]
MERCECVAEVRRRVEKARRDGFSVALVPTMGYLHEGHLALVREARQRGSFVVMSIFVNPLQFGPNEDYARYPRDLERDAALAAEAGVALLFHPSAEEMYPEPNLTQIEVGKLGKILCGASRPGHFRGAATVVGKLFNIVGPDDAYFGLKDYQQYLIIRQMAHDLNFPVRVIGVPIVREDDGLAKSSRNVFLTPQERAEAVLLNVSLAEAEEEIRQGLRQARKVEEGIRRRLEQTQGRVDYIEVRDASTLAEVEAIEGKVVIALAVYFGSTRLIDNRIIDLDTPAAEA